MANCLVGNIKIAFENEYLKFLPKFDFLLVTSFREKANLSNIHTTTCYSSFV